MVAANARLCDSAECEHECLAAYSDSLVAISSPSRAAEIKVAFT